MIGFRHLPPQLFGGLALLHLLQRATQLGGHVRQLPPLFGGLTLIVGLSLQLFLGLSHAILEHLLHLLGIGQLLFLFLRHRLRGLVFLGFFLC